MWELLSGVGLEIMDGSNINLTDEELEQIKSAALDKKRERVLYEMKLERQSMIDREVMSEWNSTDMLNWIQWRAKFKLKIEFVLDETNHDTVKALCRYFTKDHRFEKMGEGWKLEKGLIIAGNIGTGKTTLMKLFAQNKRASFKIISCRKMSDMFIDQGGEVLHTYSRLINVPTSLDTFYQKQIGICFDDLGTERQGRRFGDSANVMEQIILNRYDNTDAPWSYSHITTNLTADEIEEMYGTRVRSRMREMYNLITLNGSDRRS